MNKIAEIMALLGLVKEYKPVAETTVDLVVEEYGPILNKVFKSMGSALVKNTDANIKEFQELGYTKDEAILLVINSKAALQEALSNVGSKK